jgi:multidrug efflux pump subunit AcrB
MRSPSPECGGSVRSRRSAWIFLISVGVATMLVCVLFVTRSVTVKLLPFDNKSEMAVVVDLPEGATLEDTERTLFNFELAEVEARTRREIILAELSLLIAGVPPEGAPVLNQNP